MIIHSFFAILSRHKSLWGLLLLLAIECFSFSCRKEEPDFDNTPSPLVFSTDTVFFDTVFSTLNAPVQRFTIRNTSSKAIKISRIYIDNGDNGSGGKAFRFNVDGDSSLEIRNLIIEGKDSAFVFIRSGIQLGQTNLPFIVDAQFKCEVNKSVQSVYIYAYGQDAHYWTSDKIHKIPYKNIDNPNKIDTQYMPYFSWSPDSVITSDKPYVIFGYLTVPPGQTLEIPAGAKLHFAPNSGIWVQENATLKINGTLSEPVLLSGLRLEDYYKNQPGQWGQIWLGAGSNNHYIRYAVIENGSNGILLDSSQTASAQNPGLTVENTIVKNMANYGIASYHNCINGINVVVGECGKALSLNQGGSHNFIHCTFTNYSARSFSSTFSLEMRDYAINDAGDKIVYPFTACYFINSIFYGNNSRQLNFDFADNLTKPYYFDHCLIRQQGTEVGELFHLCIFNLDPLFKDHKLLNFEIKAATSPAVSAGDPSAASGNAFYDIKGIGRTTTPTVGAYEFVPSETTRW